MSILNLNDYVVQGNESLSVGELITTKLKEISLGIDAFNAKNFNKTVHKLNGVDIWKDLAAKNVYFTAASKHIPAPVFFNPVKCSFKDYVKFVLKTVPIVKLVQTQADNLYRALKTTTTKGIVPHSARNADNLVLINTTRDELYKIVGDTGVYTRGLNELYPNFNTASEVMGDFNKTTDTLKSRDLEVLSKTADQIIHMANLLKTKLDESDVVLNETSRNILNDCVNEMIDSITFTGQMVSLLNDLTRVLQLQCDEAKKLY